MKHALAILGTCCCMLLQVPFAQAQVELVDTNSVVSSIEQLTVYNNELLMVGRSFETGQELWRYDGQDISLVSDLNPGTESSNIAELTPFENVLFFRARDGFNGEELWQYNGTNVLMIENIATAPFAGSFPYELTVWDNALYFIAAINIGEVWRYDLSDVTQVSFFENFGGVAIGSLTPFGNELLCTAQTSAFGSELWSYDGTDMSLVEDSNPGGSDGVDITTNMTRAILNGDEFVYAANAGVNGRELWSYDGSTADAVSVAGSSSFSGGSPFNLFRYHNQIMFSAFDDTGRELWSYDGQQASLVADLAPGPVSSDPKGFTICDSLLYFAAEDSIHGVELWVYDGNTASLVADINPGIGGSNPWQLFAFGDELFFVANDGVHGRELWKYDGVNLQLVADISFGVSSSDAHSFTEYQGSLYFAAHDGNSETRLWKYPQTPPLSVRQGVPDEQHLRIYPNPANDQVTVSFSSNAGQKSTWSLTNPMGQVIQQEIITASSTEMIQQLDVSGLASGVYLIQVETEDYSETQRLIVR